MTDYVMKNVKDNVTMLSLSYEWDERRSKFQRATLKQDNRNLI